MKKVVFFIFIFTGAVSFSNAQTPRINIEVIIGNRQPAPNEAQLMRTEEGKHPNITKAMHDIELSMRALQEAPNDFGSHKAQAESDLKQAFISMRKALYFRLCQDTH